MPDRCPVGRGIIIHPARIGRKASDRSIGNDVFAVYRMIVFSDMVFRRICRKFNLCRVAIFAVRPAKGLGNFLQRNIKSVVLNIRLACEFERFAVPVCRIFSGCQSQRSFADCFWRCAVCRSGIYNQYRGHKQNAALYRFHRLTPHSQEIATKSEHKISAKRRDSTTGACARSRSSHCCGVALSKRGSGSKSGAFLLLR